MGMTITEKILATHAGKDSVKAGEFVVCKVDMCLGNDITAPVSIDRLREYGIKEVWDKERICLIPDHFTPNKDILSAESCKKIREFAAEYGIVHHIDRGECGVEHALLPEQGLVGPGDIVIGADSHTCTYGGLGAFSTGVGSTDLAAVMASGEIWLRVPETIRFDFVGTPKNKYVGGKDFILLAIGAVGFDGATYRAMEFHGDAVSALPMDDRLAMCNMAIEAGGKNGIIHPDAVTEEYCNGRAKRPYKFYESDKDATYHSVQTIDVSNVEPQIACPHCPDNVKGVSEVVGTKLDQVFIGSCTNGRLSDMAVAAEILKGKKVAKGTRLVVIPATPTIFRDCLKLGYIEIFAEAGADISHSTCGPCLGGHFGCLASGETCLSTSNRNFPGRMGHRDANVYLSNAAVAAAGAVAGEIVTLD